MRQAIICIKAAVLTGAMSLTIWFGLLFAGTEVIDAFFIEISLFIFLYFGVLAAIEKAPRMAVRRGKKKNNLQLIISHIGGKINGRKKKIGINPVDGHAN